MRKFKRLLSILLIATIIIPIMPIGEIQALAQNREIIEYSYRRGIGNEGILESIYIQLNVKINKAGTYPVYIKPVGEGRIRTNQTVEISETEVGHSTNKQIWINNIREDIRIAEVSIGNYTADIDTPVGRVTEVSTPIVNMDGTLRIKGESLNNGQVIISGEDSAGIPEGPTSYEVEVSGTEGDKNITLKNDSSAIPQEANYPRSFKLLGNLSILGDSLKITPESGTGGSYAYIIAENGEFSIDSMGQVRHSVFFLEDGLDTYREDNMAEIESISQNFKVIKIKVPEGLEDSKLYEVQVTNKINNPRGNIYEQLNARKNVENQFFAIGSSRAPVITSVNPESGPDTGETVTISGLRFDELDFISDFGGRDKVREIKIGEVGQEQNKELDSVVGDIISSEGITGENKETVLKLKYDVEGIEGLEYNDETVTGIKRFFAVYIGNKTTPVLGTEEEPGYSFTDDLDSISVETEDSTVTEEKEVNVIVIMQTEITTNQSGENNPYKVVNIISDDDKKYTILPSSTIPTIDNVLPDKIQVVKSAGDYTVKDDHVISIVGKDFRVIRERGNTKYPTIGIGAREGNESRNGIVLRRTPGRDGEVQIQKDGSWEVLPSATITILNEKGEEIDGTQNRSTGNRIIITIPRSEKIKIPTNSVTINGETANKPQTVYVYNPLLGSEGLREPARKDEAVMFVDIGDSSPPTIDRVTPNVVAIDSGEEIEITGSNFQQGVRVFLGGVEVSGVVHDLDSSGLNTKLIFKAPTFPSIVDGPTKVMVMNPDGGTATRDFTYTKSDERDPVLTDFSPKSGSKGTVVVVDGDNFRTPNPSATNTSGIGIYRLIGSRILMDGKDVNEYNIASDGNIELKDYSNSSEGLIKIDSGLAVLADYAHSIILEDDNRANNYYKVYYDNRSNIILSDGGSGSDDDNIINQYIISFDAAVGSLVAEKAGQSYKVDVDEDGKGLTIGSSLELKMKTPYKFTGTDIYGSRVQVIDRNRIEFRVPGLTSKLPGGYTITVENPDTKKATARDLFNYYETVSLKPEIEDKGIKPNIGSIEGGYQVLIQGKNFEDDSKVYVDGIQVAQNNIKRDTIDGKDTLIITSMPAYRRDMNEEETDRKLVPITVENGDGGTAISRFTYVIPPSAKPQIDKAEFQKENQVGSAGGDEILTITGRYFKFEEPSSQEQKYRDWVKDDERNIYYDDLDGNEEFTSYDNWRDYKEKGGEKEGLSPAIESYEEYLTSPVLPTVRIGGIEAKIVEFGNGYIRVITPTVPVGRQELYVVNNDFGTSNKVTLNFQGSQVRFNNIVPDVGKRQGEDSIEITGSGFQNSRLTVIENNSEKTYTMPLVRFGTVGEVKDINNNMAQVSLEQGDFNLQYNNTNPAKTEIIVQARYNDEIYEKTFNISGYSGETIFLPMDELKTKDNKTYPGFELVKVKTENRKLVVEKGYSPETKLDNSGKISLKSPSYHTIGNVDVQVSNPDGGEGKGRFRYTNPASKPKITNITRNGRDPEPGDDGDIRVIRLDYRGGQNITVLGEDFRTGASIRIGDVLTIDNADIVETLNADPNKLAFEMPGVSENVVGNLYRVTLINGDGATVSSDTIHNKWEAPIYIQFIKGETEPEIGNIVPDRGPATGGTKVTIKGSDFREAMEGYEGESLKVFFGDAEVPARNIKIVDYETLEVIAPPSDELGPVKVRIENPDGTLTQDNLEFTYISKPKIDDMDPKKIFTNDTETEVTIKGSQFQSGAKVIVGGEIIPTRDVKDDMTVQGEGITGVDREGNNIESSVIGGRPTATALVDEAEGTITVTFQETTDLENTSIIVINPDGGISEPYNDFQYEKPLPLKPMVLEGIPGYESTIQLLWNESDPNLLNRATRYEIYGRKTSDKENTFLGDTKDAGFLVKGLEPNTEYEFLVRALNEHGAAIDFASVKVKTLSLVEDDKLREKEEKLKEEQNAIKTKGKEEMQDGRLVITLGSDTFKNGLGTLDLSQAKYKAKDKFTIAIPIALARTDNRLTITDGSLTSVINVRDLYTLEVSRLDKGNEDAYLRIHMDRGVEQHIPRGKRVASKSYEMYFDYIYGKNSIQINEILRNGKLFLIQDTIMYSNTKNTSMYRFNIETGQYVNLNTNTTDIKRRSKVILLSDR